MGSGKMRVVYMAHPVSAPTPEGIKANLARARRWFLWITETFDVSVVADWLTCCEVMDDNNPAERAHGLRMDMAAIERCDEIWLVGGRVGSGGKAENEHAIAHGLRSADLTFFGEEPPTNVLPYVLQLIGPLRKAA